MWFSGYLKVQLGDWIIGTKDNYDSFGFSKWEYGIAVHRDEDLI